MYTSDTLITAWGETKTAAEWAQDSRATADEKIILKRYEAGQLPESAIGFRKGFDKLRAKAAISAKAKIPFSHRTATNARLIVAWGEEKSLTEWSNDPRCVVTPSCITSRLEEGLSPEDAIGLLHRSFQTKGKILHAAPPLEAFGTAKTLEEWAADSQCSVDVGTLRSRIRSGWTPEKAISIPPHGRREGTGLPEGKNRRYLVAFGERKRLSQWARDTRCKVGPLTLRARLNRGIAPEIAMTDTKGIRSQGTGMIQAFGEQKSFREWITDERCRVGAQTLRHRLVNGWLPEDAMNAAPGLSAERSGRGVVAFGERKTITNWATDPRCEVGLQTLYKRISAGMSPEAAMQRHLNNKPWNLLERPLEAFGETKTLREWLEDPRCVADTRLVIQRARIKWQGELSLTLSKGKLLPSPEKQNITAFGETKTAEKWALDERCRTTLFTLLRRLKAGATPEQAITLPKFGYIFTTGKTSRIGQSIEAFGETKSIAEWSEDSRCSVGMNSIISRLRQGWDPERAIKTPLITEENVHLSASSQPKNVYTAFGETKGIRAWAADPRCTVGYQGILQRVELGFTMEEAITMKKYDPAITAMYKRSLQITAWGESKSLKEWERDPRMIVSKDTAYGRLQRGLSPELAMGGTRDDLAKALVRPDTSPVITAWGMTKSLKEWMKDPLCKVKYDNAIRRLQIGMSPEQALGIDQLSRGSRLNNQVQKYEAFGETKTLKDWEADPRMICKITTVRQRLNYGWSFEEAITTPRGAKARHILDVQRKLRSEGKPLVPKICQSDMPALTSSITAFDEIKTIREWSKDARCSVSALTIAARVAEGLSSAEAIGLPLRTRKVQNSAGGTNVVYEALGEFQTLDDWSLDPRAKAARVTIKRRINSGESLERAIQTAPRNKKERAELAGYRTVRTPVTAFGETKLVGYWVDDPRCKVVAITITKRIRRGWKPEDAISQPPQAKKPKGDSTIWNGHLIEAFGQKLSAVDWARDPRCSVCASAITQRLKRGWEPEKAVSEPTRINYSSPEKRKGSSGPRLLTAFGETKSLTEWTRDERCKATKGALHFRLKRGMDVEAAISQPMTPIIAGRVTRAA